MENGTELNAYVRYRFYRIVILSRLEPRTRVGRYVNIIIFIRLVTDRNDSPKKKKHTRTLISMRG